MTISERRTFMAGNHETIIPAGNPVKRFPTGLQELYLNVCEDGQPPICHQRLTEKNLKQLIRKIHKRKERFTPALTRIIWILTRNPIRAQDMEALCRCAIPCRIQNLPQNVWSILRGQVSFIRERHGWLKGRVDEF